MEKTFRTYVQYCVCVVRKDIRQNITIGQQQIKISKSSMASHREDITLRRS